ncbi:MAG: shikimate kinase [Candidatus Aenigmarchaeota archaeon]|nr:shikimate kinase [Candidatus Aenigmarchaeota archaeon]
MISLIGFMGAGKSAVGKKLSKRLGITLIETDKEIEKRHGSIDRIFSEMGEKHFRKLESQIIRKIPANCIISAGGGAVLDKSNVAVLRRNLVIWLRASPKEIWKRTKGKRPLLKGKFSNISKLLRKREKLYFNASDVIIDTDGRTAKSVADGIAKIIGLIV